MRRRAWAHLFEMATAISWFLVAVSFFINPQILELSPIGHVAPPFDYIWSCLYVLGAGGIIVGVLTDRTNHRISGLVLLATGLIMQMIATVAYNPELRVGTYMVYSIACAMRIVMLIGIAKQRKKIENEQL